MDIKKAIASTAAPIAGIIKQSSCTRILAQRWKLFRKVSIAPLCHHCHFIHLAHLIDLALHSGVHLALLLLLHLQ